MSSDPLPYTQLDRAVKPKAALLAGHLGVSTQHAIGSLIEFWDLCAGDQRELEKRLKETPTDEEPTIVLDADDVALRFKLASGHAVEPVVLARLGLLEPVEEGFRVRGMSRFFEPIKRKRTNRENAAKGGKNRENGRFALDSLERSPSDGPATAGAKTKQEDSSKQSAASSKQLTKEEEAPLLPLQFDLTPPDPELPIGGWSKEDFWRWAECQRRKHGLPVQKWPNPVKLSRWWVDARAAADVPVLQEAFFRFGEAKHWQQTTPPLPFEGFMAQWSNFLPIGIGGRT